MNRRQLLKVTGTTLGAVAGVGLVGRYFLLPPSRSRVLDSPGNLARRLYAALDPELRARVCVAYDHPLRQYHNRGVVTGGVPIFGRSFTRDQRRILTDLLHAGLSEKGRDRAPNQFFVNWPGVHLMNVLICGDPHTPHWQIMLSGPHLNLRIGGRSREDVAFGGPQVYGDQRGNERQGLPGNVYRYQFEIAHRLFQSLDPPQRKSSLQARAPIQTQIEVQGSEASFTGVPIVALSPTSKAVAAELVDGILSSYPGQDAAYARECLERNGGLDAMFLSYYEDGEVAGSGEYQIFRLEGPAAVFYFRGHPHVHAFINVAMHGNAPLSVGEELGENRVVLENAAVKRLFEDAMRSQASTDFAYYDADSVVGRLRKGTIRTGDIYNLESWQDRVTIADVKGADLREPFVLELRQRGQAFEPDRMYTIATTGPVIDEMADEKLGRVASSRETVRLRNATIAYLKQHGFPQRG